MPFVGEGIDLRGQPEGHAQGQDGEQQRDRVVDVRLSLIAHFGAAGSPTWVQEVREVQTSHPACRMIDAADPERAAREVVAALNAMGALKREEKSRRPVGAAIRKPARGRDCEVYGPTRGIFSCFLDARTDPDKMNCSALSDARPLEHFILQESDARSHTHAAIVFIAENDDFKLPASQSNLARRAT